MQSGFEQNRIYSVQVLEGDQGVDSPAETEAQFLRFLSEFRVNQEFIYR